MRVDEIHIGTTYTTKIGNNIVRITVLEILDDSGIYSCRNEKTKRVVVVKARRFLHEVTKLPTECSLEKFFGTVKKLATIYPNEINES